MKLDVREEKEERVIGQTLILSWWYKTQVEGCWPAQISYFFFSLSDRFRIDQNKYIITFGVFSSNSM